MNKKTSIKKKSNKLNLKHILLISIILIGLIIPFFVKDTIIIFITSFLAIIPLAYYVGYATEELANYYSSVIGGLISSTFGNLTELVIAIFAIKSGLIEVVKASITGSIIGNILFVFGTGVLLAGFKYKEQKLSSSLTDINSTLLLITMLLFLLPSLLPIFHEQAHVETISLLLAGVMLLIYISSLIFSLITHKEWFIDTSSIKRKPEISKLKAFTILFITTLALLVISDSFVGTLETFSHILNLNELFVGVVIVGLVGNVAEHMFAVSLAFKNKVDLLITASIGSALQIALLVTPLMVFIAAFYGKELTLLFTPLEIVAIISSVLLINEINKDKFVNWFEGLALVLLYCVIAILFFYSS